MTKLMPASANLLAVLGILVLLAPAGWAQKAPAKKSTKASAASSAPAPAAQSGQPAAPPAKSDVAAGKRDPFVPLVSDEKGTGGPPLPPGKAGLVIATVRVDGAVHSPSGMIAVVSNPGDSVYFIREGDHLYDGDVEKIGLDGVTFRENSKDAFGKPVERVVTKRIYASAGVQQ